MKRCQYPYKTMYKYADKTLCIHSVIQQLHLKVPVISVHFIARDLIGKFKLSPKGHQYALSVIYMLLNYTLCIPLLTKEADEVVHTYFVNIYSKFGGLHKILLDNRTQFKNKLLM